MPSLDLKFLHNIKIYLTILPLSNCVLNLAFREILQILICKILSQIAKDFSLSQGKI